VRELMVRWFHGSLVPAATDVSIAKPAITHLLAGCLVRRPQEKT
jgi:hypothetical protein